MRFLSDFEGVVDGVAGQPTGEVAVAHALLDGAGPGLSVHTSATADSGLGWPAIRSAADGRSGDDGQSHREGQQHPDEQEPAGALPGPPRPAFPPELVGTDKGPQSAD